MEAFCSGGSAKSGEKEVRNRDTWRRSMNGMRLSDNKEKVVEDPEYLALLHSYVGTKVLEFYKRNRRAFEQDREAIGILYNYYCRTEKVWMTANELGYYLFGDEKAFEQPEGEKREASVR